MLKEIEFFFGPSLRLLGFWLCNYVFLFYQYFFFCKTYILELFFKGRGNMTLKFKIFWMKGIRIRIVSEMITAWSTEFPPFLLLQWTGKR